MLSASQEIYSQRVRLVFQNRGKLFESQYRGWALRLLVNIDRVTWWPLVRFSESGVVQWVARVVTALRAGRELCHERQSPFLDFRFHD
jgi:hypothetical protein